ncbi:hypothetical protein E4U43_004387 [Claviceps pusilla]|uniref:Rhodopsin domain-containing protein n=1 Tax=Claviceps pusilla TaxID=123648 RepID=A0A9P7N484_9HYPO|nr:hypothetical protein E4U43_004387 [Claviceps pusilla]
MAAGTGYDVSDVRQNTILSCVFFVLTPTFVLLRLWSRTCTKYGVGRDDFAILVSFLFYVAQIFCILTIHLTKSSILLLYLREFPQRWLRICSYVLLGIIVAYMVASVGTFIWQYSPIEGICNISLRPTCISWTVHRYANVVCSIVTDVLLLLLPIQPIWQSEWPVNQKRALVLVFALGGLVLVSSIMRAITLGPSTQTPDGTYDTMPSTTPTPWAIIEQNLAIICACSPTYRLVLARIFPKAFAAPTTAPAEAPAPGNRSGSLFTIGSIPKRLFRSPTHGEWLPYSGPPSGGYSRSIVQYRAGENTSQVCILPSMAQPGVSESHGRIWKTTRYEISYEPFQ